MEIDSITLVSFEGEEYTVPISMLNCSSVLSGKLYIAIPNPQEKVFLASLEIDSESLEKIIEYFSHHGYSPPTILLEKSCDLSLLKMLPPWDVQFVKDIDEEVLIKLLHSCLKLQASPLLELLCINIASRCRTIEEIQKQMHIRLDPYEAPECQIFLRNKYAWANN